MRFFLYGGILLLSFFWGACTHPPDDPYVGAPSLYVPEYAQGFQMKEEGALRILYVKKSWLSDDQNYFIYVLYPREDSLLYRGKRGYIPYPVQNAVCLSTTHVAYLEAIGQSDLITGVSGIRYLSNQQVHNRARDVGYEGGIDYELLLSIRPDVVFAYGIAGASNAYLKPLAKMGMPVVFMGDYLENHPLGKAEYMVAFSAFFDAGVMEKTVDAFREICSAYNYLSARIGCETQVVKVLMNAPFNDIWYVPGSDNYMARLVADAGGLVLGSRNGVMESRPVSLEQAYIYALEADFWLNPNTFRSLESLAGSHSRFVHIPAFEERRVFNNTLRTTYGGGSDFFERGVTEPHIILADLIKILHPEVLPEHEWVYYEQLR